MNSIPESARMEEGGFVDEAVSSTTSTTSSASAAKAKARSRLSTVSKQYDIDGDGELDDAELAMRKMDVSGRGYLTNEKVYTLMEESLRLQKDVFKMKKVIVGLLVFVVILALSNLGTSFASAILAKDTTTNDNNELVNKKTGEAVATDQAIERYESEELTSESSRRLVRYGVSSGSFTSMSKDNAHDLLKKCKRGNKIVKLTYTWADNTPAERTVCGNDWTCALPGDFTRRPSKSKTGKLCVQGTSPLEYVYINPDPDDSESYIISATDMNVLTADLTETCEDDEDCDDGLECLIEQGETVGSCSASTFCTKDAKVCPDGTTLSRVGPNCDFPECPETTSTSTTSTSTSTTIGTKPATTSTSTTSTTISTTSTTSTTTESEPEETTTQVPEVGGPVVGNIPVPSTSCETNEDCISSDTAFGELCGSNRVCGECEIGATRVHDTRPVCVDQSGGVGIWACNVSEECTVAGTTCSSPSCIAVDNGKYCSLNHEDACTTGGTAGGQQAPEELATCTSNEECAANGDGKDFCNGVCGECEIDIDTTGNDAERPLCVDQGNGIAVWVCDDSSCAAGTSCGSPSCIADIGNYCSADHDTDHGCALTSGTAGGQQAPEELVNECNSTNNYVNGTSQDCIDMYQSSRDYCDPEANVCGQCEIGTTRDDDDERPLCIDQGNGIAVWGCADSSCTVEGTSCGSPSCAADIPYYCSANHEADCS